MSTSSAFRAPHSSVKSIDLGAIIYSPTKTKSGPYLSKQRKNWLDFSDKETSKKVQNFEFLQKIKEKNRANREASDIGRQKMIEARNSGGFQITVKNGELKQTKYKGRFFPKDKVGDMSLYNLSNKTGIFVV